MKQPFFFSTNTYPFLSAMESSTYYSGIKNILKKYPAEDVIIMTTSSLNNIENRSHFLSRLTSPPHPTLGPIPFEFSSQRFDIGESRPDFTHEHWKHLKNIFSSDLTRLREILDENHVDQTLLNWDELSLGM